MPDLTAKRTLVKSPPELWEELSEVERLARHLGAFGEITITKLEPEHTVAWEGEHASGTVSIEPSGWGTKVTLRAELPEMEEPEPEPELVAEEPEPEPEPVAEPEPEDSEPVVQEPEAVAEEPEPEPVVETSEDRPRRGFWGWLFRHRTGSGASVAEVHEPAVEEPEPVTAEPEAEPVAAEPEPEPVAAEPESAPEPEPEPEPEPVAQQFGEPPALDPDRARVILDEALDALGAAHHRPFSRG
jgi:hypothetical protein